MNKLRILLWVLLNWHKPEVRFQIQAMEDMGADKPKPKWHNPDDDLPVCEKCREFQPDTIDSQGRVLCLDCDATLNPAA
jgi:hypothetical protein